MRRPLSLIVCLCLVPLALVACGDDEKEFSVSAAEAAKATLAKESAKVKLTQEIQGGGIPVPISMKAEGVTSMGDSPKLDLTFDLASLLSLAGAPSGTDGKLRVLYTDGKVYVDPPAIEQVKLPDGATWVTADLGEIVKAMGVDASAFGEFMRITPDQQLKGLEAAGDLKKVGEEKIGGVDTTHYTASIKLSDYIAQLEGEQKANAEKALKELEKLAGPEASKQLDKPQKVDFWLDGDNLMRRMVQTIETPAQQGVPAIKIKQTMDLSDYGTKVDVTPPAKDETYDATDDLLPLLEQAAKQQGLTTG